MPPSLVLMYHELEVPGRPLADPDPGYVRYCVDAGAFADQVAHLQGTGRRGRGLGDAGPDDVALTFDDGCETDLTVAAPLLGAAGFTATSFITLDFLSRRGFLRPEQVRELADAGFEIGSHGLSHRYLPSLSAADLRRELVESKARLEDLAGRAVHHLACPGGRWSPAVSAAAREAGYATVSTSRTAVNAPGVGSYELARVAVMRSTGADAFAQLSRGQGLRGRRAKEVVLGVPKRVLGHDNYDRVRAVATRALAGRS